MTTEIIIMNRQAITLAADSATTVSYWEGAQEEKRYFKGANKIFELSSFHPVGGMIYDNASLQEVPWDIIAKAFREHVGNKSFNKISGYAEELFSFIKEHTYLFPEEYQEKIFLDEALKSSYHLLLRAASTDEFKHAGEDPAKQRTVRLSIFKAFKANLDNIELSAMIPARSMEIALETLKGKLSKRIAGIFEGGVVFADSSDAELLAELAIISLFKEYHKIMERTGFVIAGFGDHEYFPSFCEYSCYGLLLGAFLYREKAHGEISPSEPSYIRAFAQTEMVDTFVSGIGEDVFNLVLRHDDEMLQAFSKDLCERLEIKECGDISDLIMKHRDLHLNKLSEAMFNNHSWPLRRVVGALPVDEMANLAENLVALQSLKEKVTKPSESVGGPIDVAVISKHDGFVWIKRKHYFDASINTRYFRRQERSFGRNAGA